MAKQQNIKAKVKKNVKKSFYEVSAPLTSTKIELYASSLEELENKTIKIDLTKNLRGKNLELRLKVKNNGGLLQGEPKSIRLMTSYVRRVMRKSADYCEDSFETDSRDAIIRIKPLLITRKRVSRAILKTLRENARKFLESYLRTRTTKEIFSEIMSNKLQKQLSLKLKKIYPLALCEIRIFEIVKEKSPEKESEYTSEKEE